MDQASPNTVSGAPANTLVRTAPAYAFTNDVRDSPAEPLDDGLCDRDEDPRLRPDTLRRNPGKRNTLEPDGPVKETSATHAARRSSQVRKKTSARPEVKSTLVKL